MKKMVHYGTLLALAGLVGIVSAEAGGSAYFYRRTMMRYNAKTERTMKMSGVDWVFLKDEGMQGVDDGAAS